LFLIYIIFMKLTDILLNINTQEIIGALDREIDFLSQDTRESFTKNTMYFAVPGSAVDGYDFIDQAIQQGAIAVISERLPENIQENICYILVDEVAPVIGKCASNFYGNPSRDITVVGVTGTNGKTSIATILSQSFQYLGKKTLLLSTAGDYFDGSLVDINRKAPSSLEVIELHRTLRLYLDQGMTHCFLEVTSHAAHQHRQRGVDFDVAIFTNLTQDHLNYHGTMQSYAEAKKMFFDYLSENTVAIVNKDDEYGEFMLRDTPARKVWYGKKSNELSKENYSFEILKQGVTNTYVRFNEQELLIPTIGDFNMYNYLAAYACLDTLGVLKQEAKEAIEHTHGAKGRFDIIEHEGIRAVVDYAHSPDSLENVLKTGRQITEHNLITVVGLGGTRDTSKRSIMGNMAVVMSDYVFFTSDNPRFDDPEEILDHMTSELDGYENKSGANWERKVDRREAIYAALLKAQSGDVVVIAGKGHEDYQEIQGVKYPFSDTQVVDEFWKSY
jgi:UDP-N-acetylmuramoyl-L-alanyl-D-glutamate--2,6-diaminopimelate ligase